MFETLSERLSGILDKLTRKGALTEADVNEAMREVRRALLEADVALDVVREFTEKVKAKAVGQEVVRSITPGQMVVKIVHDELVAVLGSDAATIDLNAYNPTLDGPQLITMQAVNSNNTKTTVNLSSVRVSCGCVTALARGNTLKPGESTTVHITMDTTRFIGPKTVTVPGGYPRPGACICKASEGSKSNCTARWRDGSRRSRSNARAEAGCWCCPVMMSPRIRCRRLAVRLGSIWAL